jgi:hypothetical protein
MNKKILMLPGGYPPLEYYGGTSVSAKIFKDFLDHYSDVFVLARNLDWRFKKPKFKLINENNIIYTNDFNLNFNLVYLYNFLKKNK